MKYFIVIVLLLLTSCKDKGSLIDNLYLCEFERERREYADFSQRETILFFDSVPKSIQGKWEWGKSDIDYIIYYSESGLAEGYSEGGLYHYRICNFSEEAKSWNVDIDGITTTCSGEAYQSCNPSATPDHVDFDFILTSFQKK